MLEGLTIEYILLILVCFIMLASILIGLIHGFKKSMFKLVATIVFWVIFWVSAPFIKFRFLLQNESLFATLSPYLANGGVDVSNHTTLMGYIIELIANLAGVDVAKLADPAVEHTIIAIIQSVTKIIYLIVLSIVYAIVRPIVYVVFFKKRNKVSKKSIEKLKQKQVNYIAKHGNEDLKLAKRIKNNEITLKRNKIYKPLGMVSGFARGLLSSFLILCVVNSTVKLLPDLTKPDNITASTENSENTNTNLYDFILSYTGNSPIVKMAVDMIGEYQNSTLIKTTGIKIGNTYADDLFVDSILTGKSKDYSFGIRKELNMIVQVAEKAFELTNGFNMESVNWTALNDKQIENLQDILLILSDDDLINNLGTVMVGITVSMDAIKDIMPSNIDEYDLSNIKWSDELETIATLVADVYSLGDLTKLDYLNLDTEKVSNIFTSLSKLQSINFLAYVGGVYGVKTLAYNDEKFNNDILNIEQTLASLATSGKLSEDIATFDDLYAQFVTLFKDLDLDSYKDEEGKISNYLTVFTSVDTLGYQNLISTIFETKFVTGVLPNVLTIIKEKLIPAEYSSIINPNVMTSPQWEAEINSLLGIVNQLTNKGEKPFEKFETFEFSQLKGFTTETIVGSELLSYAMIKLFIDASKNQGILAGSTAGITDYISVPDYLTVPADETTHKFASKWYGSEVNEYKDGELYIMLNTVKNCASELENLKNPIESLPAILSRIDSKEITNCDVLYYSLDKMLKKFSDFLVVPVNETTLQSEHEVNGEFVSNIVKKDAIQSLIEIFTGSHEVGGMKALDLRNLYVYFAIDEEGNVADEPLADDDPLIQEEDKRIVKLDMSANKLFNVLTSYYQDNEDQDGLFASGIFRATISNVLANNAGELIIVPDGNSVSTNEAIVNKDEPLKVISQKECKALVGALSDLDLKMDAILEDPLKIVDAMKANEQGDLKECVPSLFGYNNVTSTDNDFAMSSYSGILHATLSDYIVDFANDDSSSISIVVPDETIYANSTDYTLINSSETVDLIHSIVIIGTDVFNSESNQNELVDTVLNKVLDNNDALDSIIIRATLSKYLNDQNYKISSSVYETNITSKNVVTKKHFVDLVNAVESIKVAKEIEGEFELSDLLEVNTFTVGVLKESNKNEKLANSIIIRGVFEDKISKTVKIPMDSKDENDIISKDETTKLIDSLYAILDSDCTISNVANEIKLIKASELKNHKDALTSSIVVRYHLTSQIKSTSSIVIPQLAYDSATIDEILTVQEILNFVDITSMIFENQDTTLANIKVNNISTSKINSIYSNVEKDNSSLIINATISKEIDKVDKISKPTKAYEDGYIKYEEMQRMFNMIYKLVGDQTITNISLDGLKVSKLNDVISQTNEEDSSLIINATISDKLENLQSNNTIAIPNTSYSNNYVKYNEQQKLFAIINEIAADNEVNNMSIDNITINKFYTLVKDTPISQRSEIFNATISEKLIKVENIVVPLELYENKQIDYDELIKLFRIMDELAGSKTITDPNIIDSDNLIETIAEFDNSTGMFESIIFRATATKLMQDKTKFTALSIEKGDLGLVGTQVDVKNNDIEIISNDEFIKLHNVIKELTSKHSDKGNVNQIFASLSVEDYSASADVMMQSEIVRKEMSLTIKEEFENNTSGLIFLENLYNKEVPGKVYIDRAELGYLFDTMDIVNKHHPEMTDFNFSFDINESSFIYELTDEEIDLIFNSALISYNIRNHIVESNYKTGEGAYFEGVLVLTETIDPSEINTVYDLNDESKYTYTTVNIDGSYSHIHDLVKALIHLEENGYIEVVTNKDKYNDIEKYKEEAFILNVTNDRILRDSLPGIIKNVEQYNKNTHIGGQEVQHYEDNIPQNMSVEESILYWQDDKSLGGKYWEKGELYHFIDFISASNDIITNNDPIGVSDDIDRMLASDLAHTSVDEFLTNEKILLLANPLLTAYGKQALDASSVPVDENNLRIWESVEGQTYIDDFSLAYVAIKTQIVME